MWLHKLRVKQLYCEHPKKPPALLQKCRKQTSCGFTNCERKLCYEHLTPRRSSHICKCMLLQNCRTRVYCLYKVHVQRNSSIGNTQKSCKHCRKQACGFTNCEQKLFCEHREKLPALLQICRTQTYGFTNCDRKLYCEHREESPIASTNLQNTNMWFH